MGCTRNLGIKEDALSMAFSVGGPPIGTLHLPRTFTQLLFEPTPVDVLRTSSSDTVAGGDVCSSWCPPYRVPEMTKCRKAATNTDI